MKDWKKKCLLGAGAALTLQAGVMTQAAVITWSPATDTTSASDVISGGAVVQAVNGGDAGIGTITVNDVDFVAGPVPGLANVETNPLYISGTSGDANFDQVLSSTSWGAGSLPHEITISGLTVGKEYQVQFFYTEQRTAGWAIGREVILDGGATSVAGNNGDLGQNAIGTFTADDTEQVFTAAGSWGDLDVTAYVVREVPEPASFMLLSFGSFAMLSRKNK